MGKKITILAIAFAIVAFTLPAYAQQAEKVYRIGFLTPGSEKPRRMAAFRQALQELGYVEGKNLVIEERYAKGWRQRLPALAAELVGLKVDIFVTHGDATLPADRAATKAGKSIPVVFAVAADPIGSGFVASLARPGGNITGLSDSHSILVPKRLELLKEVIPSITRVAVFWSPISGFTRGQLKILETVAPALGITLLPVKFGKHQDVERAFAVLRRGRPHALNVLGYPFSGIYGKRILEFARENRLPTIHTGARHVANGALMSYGVKFDDQYRRAAAFVDKILKGARPADLPVEQPTRFYLTVNLKTAKALGITFPQSILLRADKVIE